MKPKIFSLVLLVSLALNALLGGWIIARAIRKHSRPDHSKSMQGASGPHLLRRLVGAAGGPRDPRFRELEGSATLEFRKFRRELSVAQTQVDAELRAEPFAAARFEHAVRELEALEVRGIHGANELALRLAPKLTNDERRRASSEHKTTRPVR